jgi:hypothetical protein
MKSLAGSFALALFLAGFSMAGALAATGDGSKQADNGTDKKVAEQKCTCIGCASGGGNKENGQCKKDCASKIVYKSGEGYLYCKNKESDPGPGAVPPTNKK